MPFSRFLLVLFVIAMFGGERVVTAQQWKSATMLRSAVLEEIKSGEYKVHDDFGAYPEGDNELPRDRTGAPMKGPVFGTADRLPRTMLYCLDVTPIIECDHPDCRHWHRALHHQEVRSAYDYPWQLQRNLELLKGTVKPLDYLQKKDVDAVQRLIARQLEAIGASPTFDARLSWQLVKFQEDGYAIFDKALADYFRRVGGFPGGAEITGRPKRRSLKADPMARIKVKTTPAGAFLSYAVKDEAAIAQKKPEIPVWLPLPVKDGNQGNTFGGDYDGIIVLPTSNVVRIRAVWPGRTSPVDSLPRPLDLLSQGGMNEFQLDARPDD